jgi:hypothetical protein
MQNSSQCRLANQKTIAQKQRTFNFWWLDQRASHPLRDDTALARLNSRDHERSRLDTFFLLLTPAFYLDPDFFSFFSFFFFSVTPLFRNDPAFQRAEVYSSIAFLHKEHIDDTL